MRKKIIQKVRSKLDVALERPMEVGNERTLRGEKSASDSHAARSSARLKSRCLTRHIGAVRSEDDVVRDESANSQPLCYMKDDPTMKFEFLVQKKSKEIERRSTQERLSRTISVLLEFWSSKKEKLLYN